MGHWWSTKWEALHAAHAHLHSSTVFFIWTAAIVETSLTLMIQLWEQLNSADVHGKSESEQKQRLLQRQKLMSPKRPILVS